MSSFLRPSRTKSSSVSETTRSSESKNFFQARLWIGWLLMSTPSMSKITPLSISLLLVVSFKTRPVFLSRPVIFHRSHVDQIFLDLISSHTTDQTGQDIIADVSRD